MCCGGSVKVCSASCVGGACDVVYQYCVHCAIFIPTAVVHH